MFEAQSNYIPENVGHLQQLHGHPNLNDHQKCSKHHFDFDSAHSDDLRQHLQELSDQRHGIYSRPPSADQQFHILYFIT